MRYRFVGDPAEREDGQPSSRTGEWLDMPSDPAIAGKIMGNSHYEVEGVPVLKAPAKRKAKAEPKPVISTDGWEEDDAESH